MLQESNRIELKEKLNEKLEKEICAFLNNREGGALYIGISDDGEVVGVSDADALQKKVAERIRDNILPSALGLYDVTSEQMDGKTVIKVIVSSGTESRIIQREGVVVGWLLYSRGNDCTAHEYFYDRRALFQASAQSDVAQHSVS